MMDPILLSEAQCMEGRGSTAVTRVLMVEDHEPFRILVRSIMESRQDLHLVGEAGDGLAAVRRCLELRPDLILLDIGLPVLNGIQVARQIRQLIPTCKIVFLTQERSDEIVQEAFGLGAAAYVSKAHTASDLLPALTAAQHGREFLSSGLNGRSATAGSSQHIVCADSRTEAVVHAHASATYSHRVDFYNDNPSLVAGLTGFVENALRSGNSVMALVTNIHRQEIIENLEASGIDTKANIAARRLVLLNVLQVSAKFMVNGQVNSERLLINSLETLELMKKKSPNARISACGECASSLLAQGNAAAALKVERLWDDIARLYGLETFCGYLVDNGRHARALPLGEEISAVHSQVIFH